MRLFSEAEKLDLNWCNLEGILEEVEVFRIGTAGLWTFWRQEPQSEGKSAFM